MQVPVVETERLRLRAWRKEDFRPYHDILKHPDVHRHFGPEPMSAEECWRRVMASSGCWQLNGFGTWAVTRKSDGKLIGNAGIFTAWRDLDPEFGEEPEMGWIFSADTHGQGMASEACQAVIGWTEANLAPTPLWAIIAPANEPSLRLAAKLGFERVHETPYHKEPTVVLRRPAW